MTYTLTYDSILESSQGQREDEGGQDRAGNALSLGGNDFPKKGVFLGSWREQL